MKFLAALLLLAFTAQSGFAQDQDKTFSGETEASAVTISGNSNTETYSGRTKNTYAVSKSDLATLFGKYVRGVAGGTENNKAWEAGLRYDRIFSKDLFNGFLQRKAEHDPYNGVFIQRDSSDLGVRYTLEKTDYLDWFAELGYRYQDTYEDTESGHEIADFILVSTEAEYKFFPTTTGKLRAEYLFNLKRSKEYQGNIEASVNVAITSIFSLKTSYFLNHDESNDAPLKKDTSTWTTTLVAKY